MSWHGKWQAFANIQVWNKHENDKKNKKKIQEKMRGAGKNQSIEDRRQQINWIYKGRYLE